MKRNKVYISGKISGLDLAIVDAKFQGAEDLLRSKGFDVVNPRKLDHSSNTSEDWGEYMRVDLIVMLAECDKIYYLPCWQDSTGAVLEFTLAQPLMFETITYQQLIKMPDALNPPIFPADRCTKNMIIV